MPLHGNAITEHGGYDFLLAVSNCTVYALLLRRIAVLYAVRT